MFLCCYTSALNHMIIEYLMSVVSTDLLCRVASFSR